MIKPSMFRFSNHFTFMGLPKYSSHLCNPFSKVFIGGFVFALSPYLPIKPVLILQAYTAKAITSTLMNIPVGLLRGFHTILPQIWLFFSAKLSKDYPRHLSFRNKGDGDENKTSQRVIAIVLSAKDINYVGQNGWMGSALNFLNAQMSFHRTIANKLQRRTDRVLTTVIIKLLYFFKSIQKQDKHLNLMFKAFHIQSLCILFTNKNSLFIKKKKHGNNNSDLNYLESQL